LHTTNTIISPSFGRFSGVRTDIARNVGNSAIFTIQSKGVDAEGLTEVVVRKKLVESVRKSFDLSMFKQFDSRLW